MRHMHYRARACSDYKNIGIIIYYYYVAYDRALNAMTGFVI